MAWGPKARRLSASRSAKLPCESAEDRAAFMWPTVAEVSAFSVAAAEDLPLLRCRSPSMRSRNCWPECECATDRWRTSNGRLSSDSAAEAASEATAAASLSASTNAAQSERGWLSVSTTSLDTSVVGSENALRW